MNAYPLQLPLCDNIIGPILKVNPRVGACTFTALAEVVPMMKRELKRTAVPADLSLISRGANLADDEEPRILLRSSSRFRLG